MKLKLEKEGNLREINADNCFLIKNLQNEIEFIQNKIKNKEKLLIRDEISKEEIDYEKTIFKEKKKFIGKIKLL